MDELLPDNWDVIRHILCDARDHASVASLAMTCRTARAQWQAFKQRRHARVIRSVLQIRSFLQACVDQRHASLITWAFLTYDNVFIYVRCTSQVEDCASRLLVEAAIEKKDGLLVTSALSSNALCTYINFRCKCDRESGFGECCRGCPIALPDSDDDDI